MDNQDLQDLPDKKATEALMDFQVIKNPEVSKDHQADLEALNLKVKKETIETLD